MSDPFIPNQQLLSLQTTGLPGLSGTTLPRSILADLGWPDALIEDYDAKGLNSGDNSTTLTLLGEQTFQAQQWNRENQLSIEAQQNQINQGELRLVEAERQVSILSNTVTDLQTRLMTAEQAITDLSPLTGTATPEGVITSNRSQTYYQISGSTTEIFFNPQIGVNTGWRQMT